MTKIPGFFFPSGECKLYANLQGKIHEHLGKNVTFVATFNNGFIKDKLCNKQVIDAYIIDNNTRFINDDPGVYKHLIGLETTPNRWVAIY